MKDQEPGDRGPEQIGEKDILGRPARPFVLLLGLLLLGGGLLLGLYLSGILGESSFGKDIFLGVSLGSFFALPGLGIVLVVLYAHLSDALFGEVRLDVSPSDLRIGDELTIEVAFDANFPRRIGGVFATVEAVQTDDSGARYLPDQKRVRYRKGLTLSRSKDLVPGEGMRWTRTFEIPRGSPATFHSARTGVDWVVRARVSVPWWPDLRRRKRIVVHA
jgi:hypothetical protein